MNVLHLISGGDKGGAKTHVFTLLGALMEDINIRVICFMEGVFYQEIKETDIPSMLIMQRYRNDLTIIGKLARHIRAERYDLIHAHGARANFIALMLRPFVKIPMITTVHSDYRLDFTDGIYKKLLFTKLNAGALRLLDYYIAVSNQFKDMLSARGFDPGRIYTVYNSIDFDGDAEFAPKADFLARCGINPGGRTLVGIIGRFEKVKGHDVFLRAAAHALKENGNLLFLLAGEGPEQHNLENLAKSLGIWDSVKFLGFVDDIYSFVNAIDINALSSHSESFPYVLLEGAKMCKATVSTAVGGIPDLIIDGKTGLLSPPGDDRALAEKILALARNKEMARELGANLNHHARTNFSKESMKERHIEIYTDVLKRHKAAGKLFDVMLSGYYGFKNSGDDALLKAIIDSLRAEKPDISIAVLSKNPKDTAAAHSVAAFSRTNLFGVRQAMKRSRLFLNGGGSLIQDITSTQSLIYYTTLIHFAKSLGLKIMLYANGIGPIIKKRNESIARNALLACDYITLRETESFAELAKLGVEKREVLLTSDPTFAIKPAPEKELARIMAAENIDAGGKYAAISIRQWRYNDANFVAKMAEVIDAMSARHGLVPLFIPMQQPHDVFISKEVMSRLSAPAVLLSGDYDAAQLMAIVGKTQLVMAMRLHALVYAVSMGVPVVGIVYDPKIKSFMEYVNQKTYAPCDDIDTRSLSTIINGVMENREAVRADVEAQSRQLKALANRDAKIAIGLT